MRKALSFASKEKSLAAGALRLGRGPGEAGRRRLLLGGGGQGLDPGPAGEAGGHALPERVQARAFAGHLEQGIAFQRRAHHVAAERGLAIVGLSQQATQARGARRSLSRWARLKLGGRRWVFWASTMSVSRQKASDLSPIFTRPRRTSGERPVSGASFAAPRGN